MAEFRAKINIVFEAEDIADAFGQLSAITCNRANAAEGVTPDPEVLFTGEIDMHLTSIEKPESEFNEL